MLHNEMKAGMQLIINIVIHYNSNNNECLILMVE